MRRPSLFKKSNNVVEEPENAQVIEFALPPINNSHNAPPEPPIDIDDPPPDGGYGWVVCGAVSLINGFTWGVAASYGVYLSYYLSSAHFPTATAMDYAFIGGLIFGCALLFSPLWTILTREIGRKTVMTAGCVLMSAGFVAASFATAPWHLYLSQGAAVGTGLGAIFIPSVQVVPQWFLRRRSLAGGIASAGSGFGGLAFALATDAMIRNLSLAWSLRITGLVCFAANLLGTALIRDRNADVKPPQLGFATHLLRRYDCLLLLAWAFTNVLGYIVILYSVSAYAVQVAGLTQKRAGVLTAVLNLGTGVGRPAAGLVSDRFGRVWVAAWITLACAGSVFAIWIPAESFAVLVFFSLVSGAILGVYWMCVGPLCAEVAGLKEVPSFLSLQWLTVVLPTTFAEVIALYLRRPEMGRWGYLYTQVFAGVAYVVAAGFLFELWRIKKAEKLDRGEEMGIVREWMVRFESTYVHTCICKASTDSKVLLVSSDGLGSDEGHGLIVRGSVQSKTRCHDRTSGLIGTPAHEKNAQYFSWDFVMRTIAYTINADPKLSNPRDENWQDALSRSTLISSLLLDEHPGFLSSLVEQTYPGHNPGGQPEMSWEVIAAAEDLQQAAKGT